MQAYLSFGHCRNAKIEMTFEDFLCSGHVCRQAKAAMCSADDLILDYVPSFDPGDADEVREAFGEACSQAADGEIDKVQLDDDDIRYIRQHFIKARRFRLIQQYPPEAA